MISVPRIHTSNVVTLARTFFAISFLATLIFTPLYDLFPNQHITSLKSKTSILLNLNYFLWFENIYVPYLISIAILIICITGFAPKYMSFLQCWVSYSIFYSALVTEGGDQINAIMSLLFIPLCYSDKRLNGWKIKLLEDTQYQKNIVLYNSFMALLFIKIQISLLYFNAGVAKIFAPEWSNGTAVYYWFYDPTFGAPNWLDFIIGGLFKNNISVTLINWGVIFLEISLFISFFFKQNLKYIIFTFGIIFHALIIIVHGLPSFGLSMTGCLIIYLFDVELTITENLNNLKKLFYLKSYVAQ